LTGFSDRLRLRHRLWWQAQLDWRRPPTWVLAVHGQRDLHTLRRHDDPDAAWRCCDHWPRKLLNKWNARQFAIRHDVAVPSLYAFVGRGRRVGPAPARHVIRPLIGSNKEGVQVIIDGQDVLRDRPPVPARGPCLVEEFIPGEDLFPLEYKCHVFGARVGAIQVFERRAGRAFEPFERFYGPDWSDFPVDMGISNGAGEWRPPPPFLGELLELCARLGPAVGTYMRIDFFGGPSGPVFNEFSSTPSIKELPFTPYCDELFGQMWDDAFAGAT
jgi:hypothetical protein